MVCHTLHTKGKRGILTVKLCCKTNSLFLECANTIYSKAHKGLGQVGSIHVGCPHHGIYNHQTRIIWPGSIHNLLEGDHVRNVNPILYNVSVDQNPWPIVYYANLITCNPTTLAPTKTLEKVALTWSYINSAITNYNCLTNACLEN